MANNKTNSFEEAVLENWFKQTVIPNFTGSDLYIALFTSPVTDADLEGGSFNDECNGTNYTNYARVAVVRTASGWTVSGSQVSNAATVSFPQSGGGTAVITHAAVCKTLAGTTSTDMVIWGALNNQLTVTSGVTPQFATGNIIFTEQ